MNEMIQTVDQWAELVGPNLYLQATAIVLVGLVIAKIAETFICNVCARLVARTSTHLDDRFIAMLHRPVFVTIAVFGLILATYRLQVAQSLEVITLAILKSIVILMWLRFALGATSLVLDAMRQSKSRFPFAQKDTVPLMRNLMVVLLLLAGAYSILVAWDINVTGLVASAGIVGLALSFAAQDTLSHLFAGVAIVADRPYKIGDYVVLDTGERGEVTNIGLRSTRLLTRDDVEVTVPNGVMGSAKIVNESGGPHTKYRTRVAVGVAYGSDIDQVTEVLQQVAIEHEQVCTTPEPRVRFRRFGDSSLDFELLCWINEPAQRGLVIHELNCTVYKEFANNGIQIPFPQRDLHIREMPETNA